MAWTYILECADGRFYVGSTTDLERRVSEHNLGEGAAYTRPRRRRPVQVRWSAQFERVDDAYDVEKQLQNWSRAKRRALIDGRFADLPALARGHCRRPLGERSARSSPGLDDVRQRSLLDQQRSSPGLDRAR